MTLGIEDNYMTPLEIVITSIGGSAALFAIVGFLARSLVLHLLSKDIATFKSDLEKIAYEHQVRFSQLHEKRAEIIATLYASIVELKKVKHWCSGYRLRFVFPVSLRFL